MTRSVVIGDAGAACDRLTRALGAIPDVEPVGQLSWRKPARHAIEALQPDLIFVDEPAWSPLPLAVIREARCAAPTAVVIVRAADPTADWLADALVAGATVVLPAVFEEAILGVVVREALEKRDPTQEAVRLGWAA
jgi:chemotaxis response regulator CheB